MTSSFDVAVVGLGGAGSAAAYHLARRGARVLGLEAAGPANSTGASHGGSRIVRMAYAEGDAFMPLLRRAHVLWDELGEEAGGPVLRCCGVLFAGRPDSEVVAATVASAARNGLPVEVMNADDLRRRSPLMHWPDDSTGCFDARAGVVSPELAVGLHLMLARRHGAELRFNTRLLGWTADGDGLCLRTDAGDCRAAHLVVCAGAWAPALVPGLPRGTITVQRQVQHWFDVPPAQRPGLDAANCPVHVWDDDEAGLFYSMPMLDGPGGGLKCCLELAPPATTADAIDRTVSSAEVSVVADVLRRHAPWAGPWMRGAVCHYAGTGDNRFVVGPVADMPDVTCAFGLGGHGFKFTPAIGELVSDIVLGSAAAPFAGPFDPSRLSVMAARDVGELVY